MFYIDQMGFTKPYFIKGPFINKKHLFETAVRDALANNEFASIRREHYLSRARQN